ncbi:hypothetical protein HYV83_00270 [Candidatus Woesearchaeota archaeon]|nr:hypothetical protein [Candidatus Woesearchaeota archaeon]
MRSAFIPGVVGSIVLLLFLLSVSVLASVPVSAQYVAPLCGDNFCDPDEQGWCSDCDTVSPYCGDSFCDPGESTWCSDCTVPSYCGDNFCDPGESGWCSDCDVKPFCGDGFCDSGEQGVCAKDCGACDEKFLDSYRCGTNGYDRQREKQKSDCSKEWVTLDTCAYGCRKIWADSGLPVGCEPAPDEGCTPVVSCVSLGCGKTDSCGNFCGSCPAPAVVDNAPTATINVPASAAPGSQLSILVTGNDDKDVSQLLLFDSSNVQIGTPFDCAGILTSCSHAFTVTAPSAFSTAYTFKARSKDSANQLSGFVSGTGTTTAAPAVPPVVPPPVVPPVVPPPITPPPVTPPPVTPPITPPAAEVAEMPKPLQVIAVKFPLQPLFMRALNFPDTDCVRPGESALLAVKVQNTAKAALKDISFAATVPELGVRISKGPVKLKANGKLTQLLRLNIPEDAEEGTYYMRFSISNNKFSRTVHRTFVVDSSC